MKYLFLAWLFSLLALPMPSAWAQKAEAEQNIETGRQFLVLIRQPPARFSGDSAYGSSYNNAKTRAVREKLGRKIAKMHDVSFVGFWAMPAIGLDCLIMAVRDGQSVDVAANRVAKDRNVEWVQRMNLYTVNNALPRYNDPLFQVGPAAQQWQLNELHRISTGKGVDIAIVDSQIDGKHPDLAGRLYISRDFISKGRIAPEQHGTEIAGVIAAQPNNHIGTVGIAPDARLMGLRACRQQVRDTSSICDSVSLAKAIHFAIENKADIVNLSLAGPRDRLLEALIDLGLARGITFVASVDPERAQGGFPSSHKGVIGVSDTPSVAASFGRYSAPGKGIPTTQPGGKWYLVNGSSYAAAHVSGLLALMKQNIDKPKGGTQILVTKPIWGSIIDARASLLGTR